MADQIHDRPSPGRFDGSTHRLPIRVYFEDTDASGRAYHGSYLRYMERARTEMLRTAGVHQGAALTAGEGFYVVAEMAIKFRAPALLDDELTVASDIETIRAASVVIHQRVMRGQELVADATVTAAFLSPDGRPKRQPRHWLAAFERLKEAE